MTGHTTPRRRKNVIGPAVRRYREERKLSQGQLAGKAAIHGADLDRTAVNKIESGTRAVYDHEVRALARALRLPIAELYLVSEESERD